MSNFVLDFEVPAYDELDKFALLACQRYNLGNDTDWFGTFRGGLYGFYSRVHGVAVHYHIVHSWIPRPRLPTETEYHVASVLFNMDSALECLTYALNALGFAAAPATFRDVTVRKELSRISPRDILGSPNATPPRSPMDGYSLIFPTTQTYWVANRMLIDAVVDLHDVSKHRQTTYVGGMARLDPPPGFYEALGVAGDRSNEALFWPSAEILLRSDPKAPAVARVSAKREDCATLEGLAQEFVRFVHETGRLALADARSSIQLTHKEFLQSS